ncbi:MAG: hypothetical protein ACOCXA_09490 [Planctomycetota bacterium]
MDHLPTVRLSSKNQMTLPKSTDMVRGLEEGNSVYAIPFHMTHEETGDRFPVLRVLTEEGKRQREQEILGDTSLSRPQQSRLLTLMNGQAARMTVDRQNRVVLPSHLVRFIGVKAEVYIFESNGALMAWNPDDWERYAQIEESDDLASYLT